MPPRICAFCNFSSARRESCIYCFTADDYGGKAAYATFPPLIREENLLFAVLPLIVTAVKSHALLFLRSEGMKSCICCFSTNGYGGKAAFAILLLKHPLFLLYEFGL